MKHSQVNTVEVICSICSMTFWSHRSNRKLSMQGLILYIECLIWSNNEILIFFKGILLLICPWSMLHWGCWSSQRECSASLCSWPNLSLNMNINHVKILHHLPGGFWGQIRESGLFLFECHYVWSECHTVYFCGFFSNPSPWGLWPSVLLMWQPWGIQWFYSSHFLRDWMLPVWTIWEQLRQPSPQLLSHMWSYMGFKGNPHFFCQCNLHCHENLTSPLPPDRWLPHLTHPLLFPNRKQLLPP